MMVYDCMFPDGTMKVYVANIIAGNIYDNVEHDGYTTALPCTIVDHKCSGDAVWMEYKYFMMKLGTRWLCQSTIGWRLLIEWTDGTRQWMDLKLLNESNPVQVAEYAVACGIADEPAYAWWVTYVLHKWDAIVSAVKVRWTRHKYGIVRAWCNRNDYSEYYFLLWPFLTFHREYFKTWFFGFKFSMAYQIEWV